MRQINNLRRNQLRTNLLKILRARNYSVFKNGYYSSKQKPKERNLISKWNIYYDPKRNHIFIVSHDKNGWSASHSSKYRIGKKKLMNPEQFGCVFIGSFLHKGILK